MLITLLELEGVTGGLHEAYYRGAIEWAGVGRATEAIKYARMCLGRGLAVRGEEKLFVESMRELIADPERHWSWRFRLKGNQSAAGGPEDV